MQLSRNKTFWITTSILFATLLPNMIHPAFATAQSPTTLMVPLYSYPSAAWNNLAQQKAANPSVPIVAVINPSNGPGTWADPNFVTGIQTLKSAGITVIGYTHSSYASRPLASVESDILAYARLYGIGGVYIDEMNNVPGYESYYSALTQYAHSNGMSLVIGNPGADVPSSYIGTVDSIIIRENQGLPSLSSLAGWHTSYSRSNFGFIAYGMTWLDASYIASASNYVGYIYITDGVWPNPFSATPSYLSTLVGDLSQSAPVGYSGPGVTVNAVDQSGNAMNGYYAVLYQNGNPVGSGFTPTTFPSSAGVDYSVSVGDYGGCSFSHWQDTGSTSRLRAFTGQASSTTLTAAYTCTGIEAVAESASIFASTVTAAGTPVNGYYVSLWQNGVQLNTCFSSCSFTVSSGQTYQVAVSGYGSETFSHWTDGTTNPFLSVTAPTSGATSVTAVFNP